MEIIDAQVHVAPLLGAHAPNTPLMSGPATARVSPEEMVAAMRAVGVDRAMLAAQTIGPARNSDVLDAAARFPDSFAAIGTADPTAPDLDEQLKGWRSQPGMLAARIVLLSAEQIGQWKIGYFLPLLAAAERHAVPMCIYPPTVLRDLPSTIESYPDLQLVIDHLGLLQPTAVSEREPEPFEKLPDLLALARFPNVAVKLTGVATLSNEPYPFCDLWPYLHRVLGAFGPDRVIWGSDWTRTVDCCTYAEATSFIKESSELSDSDKEAIMGGTLRRIFRWPRPSTAERA